MKLEDSFFEEPVKALRKALGKKELSDGTIPELIGRG